MVKSQATDNMKIAISEGFLIVIVQNKKQKKLSETVKLN